MAGRKKVLAEGLGIVLQENLGVALQLRALGSRDGTVAGQPVVGLPGEAAEIMRRQSEDGIGRREESLYSGAVVVRADILAGVAAIETSPKPLCQLLGDRTSVLDRQVADTPPRIQPLGGQCLGGTVLETARTSPA